MAMKSIRDVQIIDIDPDVIETVEEGYETENGKTFKTTLIRRTGLARYIRRGRESLADMATFHDCGKLGMSCTYTDHRAVPYTEEEKAAGRRHIQEVAAQILVDQGLW